MPEVLLDKDEPSNSSDLVNENHSSQNMEEGSPSIEIIASDLLLQVCHRNKLPFVASVACESRLLEFGG